VPFDSAVAFHKALSPRELANPTFRIAIGELAFALHSKNVDVGVRSIGTLENLCTLSQNEPAVSYLRELAKSFGRSVQPSLGLPSTGNAPGNASRTSGHAHGDAFRDADATVSEGAKEDDTVRFSASVQSKFYDTTASPKSLSAGSSDRRESGGRRGRDRPKRESSGSSTAKKSRVSKRGQSRVAALNTKHLSDRPGNLPVVPVEAPRSQNSASAAVSPVVQLQPHTKNLDKVRRRSKKGASTPKRADAK